MTVWYWLGNLKWDFCSWFNSGLHWDVWWWKLITRLVNNTADYIINVGRAVSSEINFAINCHIYLRNNSWNHILLNKPVHHHYTAPAGAPPYIFCAPSTKRDFSYWDFFPFPTDIHFLKHDQNHCHHDNEAHHKTLYCIWKLYVWTW